MRLVESCSDGELLRRAAARDGDAFAAFYVRYEAIVAGFLARRTRNPELAADLTAETFAAAVIGAQRFQDHGQSAIGWLLGIARNQLSHSLERGRAEDRARRRLGVERIDYNDASLQRVEALIDMAQTSDALRVALAALPAGERDAVRAYVIDEQPYADLARDLGISQASLRQRVSRGLARMRATMEPPQP
jgi:RNA polymerase sigma factor (sigma-70 family)